MSIIQVLKKDSQTITDFSNSDDRIIVKNFRTIPKSKRETVSNLEEFLFKLIKGTPYPNFRFFCPYCGSLDVFITIKKTSLHQTVDCLDCKKRWIDLRLYKT